METKKRGYLIAALSGAIGAALGSVSGSRNWIIVAIVGATIALLSTWIISGMIKSE